MKTGDYRDSEVRRGFALRLRALRHAHGAALGRENYSRADFARDLGLTSPGGRGAERYSRWERGEMEPTLGVLANLRRLTGVCLDTLLAGELPGSASMIPIEGMSDDAGVRLGDRLRMVREILEPALEQVAAVMGVDPATWAKWESGAERPGVGKMQEFAHRFGGGLDFLYTGTLAGISPLLLAELLTRHPQLLGAPAPIPNGRSTGKAVGSNGQPTPVQASPAA